MLAMRPLKDADGSYASYPYGVLTGLENHALDLLFQLRDARHPNWRARGITEPITIIEIDEASIKASKQRPQKWPRDWYAQLIERANTGGATIIGLDVFLSEEGGTSDNDRAGDQRLVDAMSIAGNVVIAKKLAAGGYEEIKPLPMFAQAAYAIGFVDIPPDNDGFVRAIQLVRERSGEDSEFSFSARLVEGHLAATVAEGRQPEVLRAVADQTAQLGARKIPLRNDGNLQLDFRGLSPAFQRISAADILFNKQSQIPDDAFRDRIVLIGATNIDACDLFPTPFYEPSVLARLVDGGLPEVPQRTPGVELNANAVATMLFGQMLMRPRFLWQTLAVLLALMLVALSVFRLRALWGLIVVILIATLALVVSSWAFNAHGLILPLASAWLGMAILTPSGLSLRYARERFLRGESEVERAQAMDIFSRFVSTDVAKEMWERRGQTSFVGETRTVTIIFTDVRNFTTVSEFEPSDKVVEWLNDYFGRMNKIIESFGGHINKYLGDGLMVVFGAPMDRGDKVEACAAVDCALAMLGEVDRMNEDWKQQGRPTIKIGCGIHTGMATCGVVGAQRRLEYTVIGDTVNLAARLESTTKEFEVPILISEATAQFLKDHYALKPLGQAQVKGKTVKTTVYTFEKKNLVSEIPSPSANRDIFP